LIDLLGESAFVAQTLLFLGVMLAVAWLDRMASRPLGRLDRQATRLDAWATPRQARLLRYGLALYLAVSVWFYGPEPVYLTPELKASAPWVAWLQLSMAVALLWRRSAWFAAAGIAVLYGCAIFQYGWFHLLDYPVFLAVALYLAIDSLSSGHGTDRALAVLRVGAGITLMWAGGEKWLFPWWSYPMLENQLSAVQFGLSQLAFMFLCGFVEFCAAYALVFGRQAVQWAALFLLVPFLAAVPIFGAVDAVGHAPIIVVLAMLAITRNRLPEEVLGRKGWIGVFSYAGLSGLAMFFLLGLYCLLHQLAYPALYGFGLEQPVLSILMMLPGLTYTLTRLSRRHSDFPQSAVQLV
jgi:hypothetical protein